MYQKDRNIKIDDRVAYQAIMGNYYPPQEEYNPKRLKTIFLKQEHDDYKNNDI